MALDFPWGTLPLRPPRYTADPSSEPAHDSGVDRPTARFQTPKRPGEDLDAATTPRVRTESQEGPLVGDNELVTWDRAGALTIDADDSLAAFRCLVAGRPANDSIFSTGGPGSRLVRRIFDSANLRDSPPTHSFTCVENAGPRSTTLAFAGAAIVPQNELRMMGSKWVWNARLFLRTFRYGNCRRDATA